jgi:hypothetical protein
VLCCAVCVLWRGVWCAELRDINLADYIEEMAVGQVGLRNVFAFFRFCFDPTAGRQRYVPTPSAKTIEQIAQETRISMGGHDIALSAYEDFTDTRTFTADEKREFDRIQSSYWRPTDISEEEAREVGRG